MLGLANGVQNPNHTWGQAVILRSRLRYSRTPCEARNQANRMFACVCLRDLTKTLQSKSLLLSRVRADRNRHTPSQCCSVQALCPQPEARGQ